MDCEVGYRASGHDQWDSRGSPTMATEAGEDRVTRGVELDDPERADQTICYRRADVDALRQLGDAQGARRTPVLAVFLFFFLLMSEAAVVGASMPAPQSAFAPRSPPASGDGQGRRGPRWRRWRRRQGKVAATAATGKQSCPPLPLPHHGPHMTAATAAYPRGSYSGAWCPACKGRRGGVRGTASPPSPTAQLVSPLSCTRARVRMRMGERGVVGGGGPLLLVRCSVGCRVYVCCRDPPYDITSTPATARAIPPPTPSPTHTENKERKQISSRPPPPPPSSASGAAWSDPFRAATHPSSTLCLAWSPARHVSLSPPHPPRPCFPLPARALFPLPPSPHSPSFPLPARLPPARALLKHAGPSDPAVSRPTHPLPLPHSLSVAHPGAPLSAWWRVPFAPA